MPVLSSHPNVWNTCLQLLFRKGYRTHAVLDPEDHASEGYVTEKGGHRFAAENPIELLGLVTIFETVSPVEHAPYWWRIEGTGPDRDALVEEALAAREARERQLANLRQDSAETWAQTLREVMNNSGGTSNAASQLGILAAALEKMLLDPLLQQP